MVDERRWYYNLKVWHCILRRRTRLFWLEHSSSLLFWLLLGFGGVLGSMGSGKSGVSAGPAAGGAFWPWRSGFESNKRGPGVSCSVKRDMVVGRSSELGEDV